MKNNLLKYWTSILGLIALLVVVSCETDSNDGSPVIKSVRITDPAKADSTFTEASRGQMIVIQGENLHDTRKVYINGQEVSFNSTLNTATHLIVTIPSDLMFVEANPDKYRHKIEVETSHGMASYDFHIIAPTVKLLGVEIDWQKDDEGNFLPLVPDQIVNIIGENFVEILSIYMTAKENVDESGQVIEGAKKYAITDYSVSENFTKLTLKMPSEMLDRSKLVVECYSGSANMPFRTSLDPKPEITGVSSDYPIVGQEEFIYGRFFGDVISVIIGNNEIVIPASALTVSKDNNQITFALPSAPSVGGSLTVVTLSGRTTVDFYQTKNLVLDFDTYGTYAWGDDTYHVSNKKGTPATNKLSGIYHGMDFDGTSFNWNGNSPWLGIQMLGANRPGSIDGNTPTDNIEVRFEFFMAYPVGDLKFQLQIEDANKSSVGVVGVPFVDMISGKAEVGNWITCSFPLSKFTSAVTYGEFAFADWGWGKNPIFLGQTNIGENKEIHALYYIDNIRFVVKR